MPDNTKWEGRGEKAKGKVKEVAGRATGDEETEAEGEAEQMKGSVKETFGEAKDKVKDVFDRN
jgi:uncharacterized protein YjbJ (UPF0337 family)